MRTLRNAYVHSEAGLVTLTVGTSERTWSPSQFYRVADTLGADVRRFDGGHSGEPKDLLEELGEKAAQLLLSSSSAAGR